MALYETLGQGYGRVRQTDPRIAAHVHAALEGCSSVVNVGAGTGSYEPRDRPVIAVEPSTVMIRQRAGGAAPAVRACATRLPFRDGTFDASLAILTLHHWPDLTRGLDELRRVARRRVVILTWDPAAPQFWLADYFPEILEIDRRIFPSLSVIAERLGELTVTAVPVPHDCTDGFLGAYWRRPERLLEAWTRSAISTFSKLRDADSAVARLRADLAAGTWHDRNREIIDRTELDVGYRLLCRRLSAD